MDDNVCYNFIDLIPPNVQYNYEPIESGWIRILDLLNKPGDNGPLQCRLRQIRLPQAKVRNSEHDFNALSYVWGSNHQRYEMQVLPKTGPGSSLTFETIPLTRSLYNAIRDLRDCDDIQPKTFWIDQICINQSNDEEKSHQVSQMGKVFQYATSVWTYLGPQEEKDDGALDLMAQICDHFEQLTKTPELAFLLDKDHITEIGKFQKYNRMVNENIASDLWFPKDLFNDEGSTLFRDLSLILSGPWINRLWLFQENILNDDLTFLRGHRILRLEHIEFLCSLWYVGLVPRSFTEIRILNLCRGRRARRRHDKYKEGQIDPLSLSELLIITSNLVCKDPRDRIYALLGVATDAEQLNIYPDYSISTAQAYTNLSVALTKRRLEEDSEYSFLDDLTQSNRQVTAEKSRLCMPTWVPTYIDHGYLDTQRFDFNIFKTRETYTKVSLKNPISFEPTPAVKNGILVIKGICLELGLDRSLGTFPVMDLTAPINMTRLEQLLAILEDFHSHANGNQGLFSSFWEVCVKDRRIADSTIDNADGKAAAAQALRDVIHLLRQARSGDIIPTKDWKDHFYLPILTLPGGRDGSAYLLLDALGTLWDRSLWLSKEQHICLAPNGLQENDIAVILIGGRHIYYLRPVGDKFEYVGWGCISGFMNGEAFVDGWEDKVQTFKLI